MSQPWLWVLLVLVPFVTVLTILYLQAHAEERRRVREAGSAAVTPVEEFLARGGPGAITWGADEKNEAHLREMHEKWWVEVRPILLVYANTHPSQALRELTYEVADAVQEDLAQTQYLLAARQRDEGLKVFTSAQRAHSEAHRLVETLLQNVRDY